MLWPSKSVRDGGFLRQPSEPFLHCSIMHCCIELRLNALSLYTWVLFIINCSKVQCQAVQATIGKIFIRAFTSPWYQHSPALHCNLLDAILSFPPMSLRLSANILLQGRKCQTFLCDCRLSEFETTSCFGLVRAECVVFGHNVVFRFEKEECLRF